MTVKALNTIFRDLRWTIIWILMALSFWMNTMAYAANEKILPLGDSITQADFNYNSYRRPLWHLLNEAGYSVDFVGK